MTVVIRCMRCYGDVEYDGQPHLNAWKRPCGAASDGLVWFATPIAVFGVMALVLWAVLNRA